MTRITKDKKCRHDITQIILENIYIHPKIKIRDLFSKTTCDYTNFKYYIKNLSDDMMILDFGKKSKERFKITRYGLNYLSLLNSLKIIESGRGKIK